jgi:hypothetical protein
VNCAVFHRNRLAVGIEKRHFSVGTIAIPSGTVDRKDLDLVVQKPIPSGTAAGFLETFNLVDHATFNAGKYDRRHEA